MNDGWLSRLLGPFSRRRELRSPAPRATRSFVGRGDLARALGEGEQQLSSLARLAGYVERARERTGPSSGEAPSVRVPSIPPPKISTDRAPPARFFQTTAVHYQEKEPEPPSERPRTKLVLARLPGRPPRPQSLCRWSRLWPRIRVSLGREIVGHELDTDRAVALLARAIELNELPRRKRRVLPRRVHVVFERSERLVPFWADQDEVYYRLTRTLGRRRVKCEDLEGAPMLSLPSAGQRLAAEALSSPLTADEAVLVLGDVGLFASFLERVRWRSWAEELASTGAKLAALVPASAPNPVLRAAVAEGTSPWQFVAWEDAARSAHPAGIDTASDRQNSPERLLGLLAPTVRIEPGLLRDVRRLLPGGACDSSSEIAVWQHPDVLGRSIHGVWIDASRQERYELAFQEESLELQRRVIEIVKQWRGGTCREVWYEEVMRAVALTREQSADASATGLSVVDTDDTRAAKTFYAEFAHAVRGAATEGVDAQGLVPFFDRFTERSQDLWGGTGLERLLRETWAVVHRDDLGAVPPRGITSEELAQDRRREASESVRRSCLWQVGAELVALDDGVSSRHAGARMAAMGSPLVEIESGTSRLIVRPRAGRGEQRALADDGASRWRLPLGKPLEVVTDQATWTLALTEKPPWASAIGRDRRGLFAEFEYPPRTEGVSKPKTRSRAKALASAEPVVQRLRWIAPGRFWMGSPESEPERGSNETRHLVTLTQGYWLADTACTQALWEAVMGKNPSHFKGPRRPVETVSWNDCQAFLKTVNGQVPGLELRLPTEAEWEYACRAGTETLFSFGESITPEQVNYDGNHPYAGGATGEYRRQTVDVASLAPNQWGLYEMHGNVWEWCLDWYGELASEPAIDPPGASMGEARVLRGGSWLSNARVVRSAYRHSYEPDYRYQLIGFRFARGP